MPVLPHNLREYHDAVAMREREIYQNIRPLVSQAYNARYPASLTLISWQLEDPGVLDVHPSIARNTLRQRIDCVSAYAPDTSEYFASLYNRHKRIS